MHGKLPSQLTSQKRILFESNYEIEPKKTKLRSKSKSKKESLGLSIGNGGKESLFKKKVKSSNKPEIEPQSKKFNVKMFDLDIEENRKKRDNEKPTKNISFDFQNRMEQFLQQSRLKKSSDKIDVSNITDIRDDIANILEQRKKESLVHSKLKEERRNKMMEEEELDQYMSNPHYLQDHVSLSSANINDLYLKQSKAAKTEEIRSKDQNKTNSYNSPYEESGRYYEDRGKEESYQRAQVEKEETSKSYHRKKSQKIYDSPKQARNDYEMLLSKMDVEPKPKREEKHKKKGVVQMFNKFEESLDHKSNAKEFFELLSVIEKRDSIIEKTNKSINEYTQNKHNIIPDTHMSKMMFNNESSIKDNFVSSSFEKSIEEPSQYSQQDLLNEESERKLTISKTQMDVCLTTNSKKTKLMELMLDKCKIPVFNTDDVDKIVQRYLGKRRIKVTSEKYNNIARAIVKGINSFTIAKEKQFKKKFNRSPFAKKNAVSHKEMYIKEEPVERRSKSPKPIKKYSKIHRDRREKEKPLKPIKKVIKRTTRSPSPLSKSIIERNKKKDKAPLFNKNKGQKSSVFDSNSIRFSSNSEDESWRSQKNSNNRYIEKDKADKQIKTIHNVNITDITEKTDVYNYAAKIIEINKINFDHYDKLVESLKAIKMKKFGRI